jgi:hypothetical protein
MANRGSLKNSPNINVGSACRRKEGKKEKGEQPKIWHARLINGREREEPYS